MCVTEMLSSAHVCLQLSVLCLQVRGARAPPAYLLVMDWAAEGGEYRTLHRPRHQLHAFFRRFNLSEPSNIRRVFHEKALLYNRISHMPMRDEFLFFSDGLILFLPK